MAVGFPTKVTYANGDVFSASDINDTNGTLNTLNPTAKGSLVSASAANTASRLAVGANDLVLTAASGETTGLKWQGAWTSYTPTFTNLTVGNGTLDCEYFQVGKLVFVRISFVMGTTSSMGSGPYFTLPVTSKNVEQGYLGNIYVEDSGVAGYTGVVVFRGSSTALLGIPNVSGTYMGGHASFSATIPFTWGTNDLFRGTFVYGAL
jgi:hypothetical protein